MLHAIENLEGEIAALKAGRKPEEVAKGLEQVKASLESVAKEIEKDAVAVKETAAKEAMAAKSGEGK